MFDCKQTLYRVPYDGSFRVADAVTSGPDIDDRECRKRLKKANRKLDAMQRVLMARDRHAVLLVFQAMDAAGKDSTIRAVMRGINPAGCQVFWFRKPNQKELDHDFLWRTSVSLPERGRIGIFNRSHYEEVLIVRVHPGILDNQRMPEEAIHEGIWDERLESIRDQEKHLARNGTIILKFWLNVSRDEQKRRFLSRLDDPSKNWKFEPGDVRERGHWDAYMNAYEAALNGTSRPWAPWFAIPADNKPYMRAVVAETIVSALEQFELSYPEPTDEERAEFGAARALLNETDGKK